MDLWLANPRGFCAGVDRAVKIVEELVSLVDEPVFVRHEIVHNRSVVEGLAARGAVFVETIDEIPKGAFAIISAHGAPGEEYARARAANLRLFDATCPLVSKLHLEVMGYARAGRSVIVIGHRDHVEVIGTLSYYDNPVGSIQVVEDQREALEVQVPDPLLVGYVTQTTLAVEASNRIVSVLSDRFPALIGPPNDDICYATQNRQHAVRMLCKQCERIVVIGAPHSSNSMRMVEVARETGREAHLIESAHDIRATWFEDVNDVGLTSSASAPEHLVQRALQHIRALVGDVNVRELGAAETVTFKLPAPLVDMRAARSSRNQMKTLSCPV
jgi:4-hydroxy-3-methylbut-2-enyl diphosphate reductase